MNEWRRQRSESFLMAIYIYIYIRFFFSSFFKQIPSQSRRAYPGRRVWFPLGEHFLQTLYLDIFPSSTGTGSFHTHIAPIIRSASPSIYPLYLFPRAYVLYIHTNKASTSIPWNHPPIYLPKSPFLSHHPLPIPTFPPPSMYTSQTTKPTPKK